MPNGSALRTVGGSLGRQVGGHGGGIHGPSLGGSAATEQQGLKQDSTSLDTHRMASLRGRSDMTGKRAKQMTKQASAARLQAPKISIRSHRLTTGSRLVSGGGGLSRHWTLERQEEICGDVVCASGGQPETMCMQTRHMFCRRLRLQGQRRRENRRGNEQGIRWQVSYHEKKQVDSQANQLSSSSRRLGAGRGAPALSVVGSWT